MAPHAQVLSANDGLETIGRTPQKGFRDKQIVSRRRHVHLGCLEQLVLPGRLSQCSQLLEALWDRISRLGPGRSGLGRQEHARAAVAFGRWKRFHRGLRREQIIRGNDGPKSACTTAAVISVAVKGPSCSMLRFRSGNFWLTGTKPISASLPGSRRQKAACLASSSLCLCSGTVVSQSSR